MKFLVTGAAGMLGSSLVPALVAAGHEVIATDIDLADRRPWGPQGPPINRLDVRSREEVRDAFTAIKPEMVLHLAAETSLELSDENPDHAYLTNTIATKYVAAQARCAGIPMTYISTAGVFDGLKTSAYTEFDRPNPLNTYGASKYEGELIVASTVEEHYIIRAGWMVGGGAKKDHKFVSRIINQVKAGAQTVYAVTDKLGTPTYTPEFAKCFLGLIASESFGTYHMVCGGDGSRYDVAQRILEVLGRDDIELVGVGSEFFIEEFPSVRPYSEIMRNMVLDLQGMNTMPPWRQSIADYIHTDFPGLVNYDALARERVA
ncbi:MAG TPA: SDR family oxidoreductase [Propionibacteriaceae bacterium]